MLVKETEVADAGSEDKPNAEKGRIGEPAVRPVGCSMVTGNIRMVPKSQSVFHDHVFEPIQL